MGPRPTAPRSGGQLAAGRAAFVSRPLPRPPRHRDHRSQQGLGAHRSGGALPHTDPPACRRMWGQTRKPPSAAGPASGTHGSPCPDPTRRPAGGTCLGCAEGGCPNRGGNADPKEEPAAPALYRWGLGCAIGWEGLPPERGAGGQLSLSPRCPGTVPTLNPGMPCAQPHGLLWAAPGQPHRAGPLTKC